jgi:hypothetical protein
LRVGGHDALNFLLSRKELISFIILVKNYSLDNLYNKPEYHVGSRKDVSSVAYKGS